MSILLALNRASTRLRPTVGDDTVYLVSINSSTRKERVLTVNQAEFSPGVADVRVTVEGVGNTVGSPSGVSHGCLAEEDLFHIDPGNIAVLCRKRGWETFSDVFAESSDLADFLEKNEWRVWRVSVDSDTCWSATVNELEWSTYRQNRSLGTRVGRDHCRGPRRRTRGPFQRGKSSIQRFLVVSELQSMIWYVCRLTTHVD